MSRFNL